MPGNYYESVFERFQLIDKLAECDEKIKTLDKAESFLNSIADDLALFHGAQSTIENALDRKDMRALSDCVSALQATSPSTVKTNLLNLGSAYVMDSSLKREIDSYISRVYNSFTPQQLAGVLDKCQDYKNRIYSSNSDIKDKRKELTKKLVIGAVIVAAVCLVIFFIVNHPGILLIPLGLGIAAAVIKSKE